jgi:hypothetical protein
LTQPSPDPAGGPDPSPADAQSHLRCSELLRRLGAVEAERLSVEEVMAALGDRSCGWVMLMLALPALILPPGFAALAGAPLLLVAIQLLFGRQSPWLPRFVRTRSFSRDSRNRFFAKVTPLVTRAERSLRPRLGRMLEPLSLRFLAAGAVVMSLVLIMPVPFAHSAAAMATAAFGAALVERDGVAVLAGWALALASLILFVVLAGAVIATIVHFASHIVS